LPNLYIVERGYDDNVRLRRSLFDAAADVKAVDVGKHQINNQDVRPEPEGGFDGVRAARRGADQRARSFQQPVEAEQNQRMIVR
jgi:hypothetical protein